VPRKKPKPPPPVAPDPVAESEFAAEAALWRAEPETFVRDVLGVTTLWRAQVEVLESLRDNQRTCVAAAHDVGKTYLASCVMWWWALAFQPSKVITTAPTQRQVEQLLWSEIRSRHAQMEQLHGRTGIPAPLTTEWYMDRDEEPDWFGVGFATRADDATTHATKMVGYHSPNLLLVFDEAGGIPKAIWDSAEGLMTSDQGAPLTRDGVAHARWLAIGNPTDPTSEFARAYKSADWHSIRIDALEHPNVAGTGEPTTWGVSRKWVEQMRRKWGEHSPLWQSKVRGIFPTSGTDTLISVADFEAARRRVKPDVKDERKPSIGVDVARFGTDETVIYVIDRVSVLYVEARQGQDTMWTAGRVLALAEQFGLNFADARRISIDDTGVGGGVTDRLRELGWYVNAENFGGRPKLTSNETKLANRRTELWWDLREWVRHEACLAGASDEITDTLLDDLTTPTYRTMSDSRIMLERKADIKARIGRSPDHGDALALALAYRRAGGSGGPPRLGGRGPATEDDAPSERGWRDRCADVIPSGEGLRGW